MTTSILTEVGHGLMERCPVPRASLGPRAVLNECLDATEDELQTLPGASMDPYYTVDVYTFRN